VAVTAPADLDVRPLLGLPADAPQADVFAAVEQLIASSSSIELRTIPDVEIVEVGWEWPAASGPFTCTSEHLQAAIAAAADPGIKLPRVKLGHVGGHGETGAAIGQPVFGRFDNLRTSATGMTLIGDLVGVPAWLADILPSAYPSRSIEGDWDVQPRPGGPVYSFVVLAVALLGVELPGVTTLEDLRLLYEQGPDALEPVAAARKGPPQTMPATRPTEPPAAMVQPGDVVRAFYEEAPWSQWIREVYVEPPVLIVEDDDENALLRIPYTVEGDERTVTFGEAVQVEVAYNPVAAAAAAGGTPPAVVVAERPPLIFASRETSRPAAANPPADPPTDPEEDPPVTPTTRERLGLPEDASADDVLARIDELGIEVPDEDPTPDPEAVVDEPAPEPVAAGAQLPAGATVVDRDRLAQLEADAAAGRTARDRQVADERQAIVDAAVEAGRITPASAPSYRTELDRGGDIEATTRHLLTAAEAEGGLAPGRVPVDRRSITVDTTTSTRRRGSRRSSAVLVAGQRRGYFAEDIFSVPGFTVEGGAIIYTPTFPQTSSSTRRAESLAPRAPGPCRGAADRASGTRRRSREAARVDLRSHRGPRRGPPPQQGVRVQNAFQKAANTFADRMQTRAIADAQRVRHGVEPHDRRDNWRPPHGRAGQRRPGDAAAA
jgi:hypothetical protein